MHRSYTFNLLYYHCLIEIPGCGSEMKMERGGRKAPEMEGGSARATLWTFVPLG